MIRPWKSLEIVEAVKSHQNHYKIRLTTSFSSCSMRRVNFWEARSKSRFVSSGIGSEYQSSNVLNVVADPSTKTKLTSLENVARDDRKVGKLIPNVPDKNVITNAKSLETNIQRFWHNIFT